MWRCSRPATVSFSDLSKVDPASDVGLHLERHDLGRAGPGCRLGRRPDRSGLSICDATSACFAQALDWPKLDVVTFSWQKALGGEGAHGMLILSPRAVERLESYTPPWPMPKVFRLTKGGKLIEGIFEGETINTLPSMLCVEDYLDTLNWAKAIGGLQGAADRAGRRQRQGGRGLGRGSTPWVDFLAKRAGDPLQHTSVCSRGWSILARRQAHRGGASRRSSRASPRALEKEGVRPRASTPIAIRAVRLAHLVRGDEVERADVEALTLWLDWAFAKRPSRRCARRRDALRPIATCARDSDGPGDADVSRIANADGYWIIRLRGSTTAIKGLKAGYRHAAPKSSSPTPSLACGRADLQGSRGGGRFPAEARRRQGKAGRAGREFRRPRGALGDQGHAENPGEVRKTSR